MNAFIKTHQNLHVISVHFPACKLFPGKKFNHKTKQNKKLSAYVKKFKNKPE